MENEECQRICVAMFELERMELDSHFLFQSEGELGGKYMRDRVRAVMADIFMIDLSYISETTSMKTLSQWDSMAQLHLITALEEEFNITFDVDDFEIMTDFTHVLETLEAKL